MHNSNNIKETIRTFIGDSTNFTAFDDDENYFESGFLNSLFAVQLMTFLERKFNIEIGGNDLDIENFKSVNATAAFVEQRTSGRIS